MIAEDQTNWRYFYVLTHSGYLKAQQEAKAGDKVAERACRVARRVLDDLQANPHLKRCALCDAPATPGEPWPGSLGVIYWFEGDEILCRGLPVCWACTEPCRSVDEMVRKLEPLTGMELVLPAMGRA
jgi:hypothetical protein